VDYPLKTLSQLRPILVGFRKNAGLTQEAVATRLGISQQSYAAFEANPETASVERLFRVLRLFDVEIKLGAAEAQAASSAKQATPRVAAKTPPADKPPRKSAPKPKSRENW
jgi:HTH-type transcriptional regulator / antitoxin HipB